MIRLLVTVPVRLYRDALTDALAKAPTVQVAGTAGSRADARNAIRQLHPEVVLVDVTMPDALELMRDVRLDADRVLILAIAVVDQASSVIECAEAGASGFVTSEASVSELVTAIERVVRGELVCSPALAAALFRRLGARDSARPTVPAALTLTPREREVLALIRQGLSNKEIAEALNIAASTAKNHVHHLLEKLQVPRRAQAAAFSPRRFKSG